MLEGSDENIRRKLVQKYNSYYRHWMDFNFIVALFALVGLFLSIIKWESQFKDRSFDGTTLLKDEFFTDIIVCIVSIMGGIAIILKYYFESIWQNYKNPMAFYKTVVKSQVEAGIVNEEDLTENFKVEKSWHWMLKQYTFWIELFLMLLVPLPFKSNNITFVESTFKMDTINWLDNSG